MPIIRMSCANAGCGSDLVRDNVTLVNTRTGKPAEVRIWALQAALLILSCTALAAVQLMRPGTARLILDFAVVVGFAALSLLSFALLSQPAVVARLVPTVRLHTYTCQICGYTWQTCADEATRGDIASAGAASSESPTSGA